MLCYMLSSGLILSAARIFRAGRHFRLDYLPYFSQLQAFQMQHLNTIVFVRPNAQDEKLLDALSWFNIARFLGDIIVARDIGERNRELTARYLDYRVMRINGPNPSTIPHP